jgi:hypothetical protein
MTEQALGLQIGSEVFLFGDHWRVESFASYNTGNRVQLKSVSRVLMTMDVNEEDIYNYASIKKVVDSANG